MKIDFILSSSYSILVNVSGRIKWGYPTRTLNVWGKWKYNWNLFIICMLMLVRFSVQGTCYETFQSKLELLKSRDEIKNIYWKFDNPMGSVMCIPWGHKWLWIKADNNSFQASHILSRLLVIETHISYLPCCFSLTSE